MGRGEEERGEASEEGSGGRKRDGNEGGGERERAERKDRREEESGEWEGNALYSTPNPHCRVATFVISSVTYIAMKHLRAQQSADSFGSPCYPVRTTSAQGTRRKVR